MHALQWIAEHGHHLRSLDAAKLRKSLDRPKGTCTWCGAPVGRGRQTWCSPACVEAFRLRCDPASIRRHIERTRPLVCAICGRDIGWLLGLNRRATRARDSLQSWPLVCSPTWTKRNRRGRRNLRRMKRWAAMWGEWKHRRSLHVWLARRGLEGLWEADHVVPVVEGGGLCEESGYRILCIPCHRAETATLAARRAEARRPSKRKPSHYQPDLLEK